VTRRFTPALPRLEQLDLTFNTWRGRSVRYVLIYLALSVVLVGTRYATQQIRPDLRAMQDREAALISERDQLQLSVQALHTPQAVREWAFANGMRRFAEARKTTATIAPIPPPAQAGPPPTPPERRVQVRTEWK
jgi:hypothetical protein